MKLIVMVRTCAGVCYYIERVGGSWMEFEEAVKRLRVDGLHTAHEGGQIWFSPAAIISAQPYTDEALAAMTRNHK